MSLSRRSSPARGFLTTLAMSLVSLAGAAGYESGSAAETLVNRPVPGGLVFAPAVVVVVTLGAIAPGAVHTPVMALLARPQLRHQHVTGRAAFPGCVALGAGEHAMRLVGEAGVLEPHLGDLRFGDLCGEGSKRAAVLRQVALAAGPPALQQQSQRHLHALLHPVAAHGIAALAGQWQDGGGVGS